RSRPDRVWNRIPDNVRRQIIALALEVPELSPRGPAVRFTDEQKYFVSEASVYRLMKAHDFITHTTPLKIAFYSKTTTCPAITNGRSKPNRASNDVGERLLEAAA